MPSRFRIDKLNGKFNIAHLSESRIYMHMHTVAEMDAFSRQAKECGMTEEEIEELIDYLAANPTAGDMIAGTGGCRKLRVAGRGKGKSGGYRTITFYSGKDMPVFLIACFSKGERMNLSKRERNLLSNLTVQIRASYAERVVQARARA